MLFYDYQSNYAISFFSHNMRQLNGEEPKIHKRLLRLGLGLDGAYVGTQTTSMGKLN